MHNKILNILWVLLISFLEFVPLNAQIDGLELIESDSIHTDLSYESYNLAFIYLKNTRADSLFLTWEITNKELPEDWYATICDNVFCYGVIPDSGVMYGIAPQDSVYIRFEVNPYMVEGFGRVDLDLVETGSTNVAKADLTYTFLTKNFTNTQQIELADELFVFPNPFLDQVSVQNPFDTGSTLSMLDASGRVFYQIELAAKEKRVLNLPSSNTGTVYGLFETNSFKKVIPLIRIQ
jgi:hypothetical protein